MSYFIDLAILDKEQSLDVISYVNVEQIRCIIPKKGNTCKIVLGDNLSYIVKEDYEDVIEKIDSIRDYKNL